MNSEAIKDCVFSNEMSARRSHIKKECTMIRTNTSNSKLDALKLDSAFSPSDSLKTSNMDTARLYVFKYRLVYRGYIFLFYFSYISVVTHILKKMIYYFIVSKNYVRINFFILGNWFGVLFLKQLLQVGCSKNKE